MPCVWSLDAAGHMCSLNIIWMQLVSSRGKQQIEEIQGTIHFLGYTVQLCLLHVIVPNVADVKV